MVRERFTHSTLQGPRLGLSLDLVDHSQMQISTASWAGTVTQTLMQFPDRISQPGQLQGAEFDGRGGGLDGRQPEPGRRLRPR